MSAVLRTLVESDLPRLAELNDAAVPAVNPLGLEGLATHAATCDLALVAEVDGTPAAMLLALAPGADYASENYAWFSTHRPGSLYVDRVVVAPHASGRGLGRALYAVVADRAGVLGLDEVTCEVNLDPPNPASMTFHRRLGFAQVGTQTTKDGQVRVALLAAPTGALVG